MGLRVVWIAATPSFFVTAEKPHSQKRPWIANVCYEVRVENLNFKISDECVEIGFFNVETIANISVFENVSAVVGEMKIKQHRSM